jgi:UPF0271 protein
MTTIDLNCDLGEGCAHDAELMPLITSANIACGAYAGDAGTMRKTVELAMRHGVAIGAHPGLADRENFGRKEILLTPDDAALLVLEQVQRLQAIAYDAGAVVRHVKLHGALYNQVSRDWALSEAVVRVLWTKDKHPILYVLAGSELERVARKKSGARVVPEVFADRSYQSDGSLTPRSRPDAMITDEKIAVAQVLRMVRDGTVRATNGTVIPISAGTVCLHGDGPHAVTFARCLRQELAAIGVVCQAPHTTQ